MMLNGDMKVLSWNALTMKPMTIKGIALRQPNRAKQSRRGRVKLASPYRDSCVLETADCVLYVSTSI